MRAALPLAVGVLALFLLAGCGGGSKGPTTTTTTPAAPKLTSVRIYLLLHGKVQPVQRQVAVTSSVENAAFGSLVSGPVPGEMKRTLATAMPPTASWTVKRTAAGLLALKTGRLSRRALAQTVFTLTQFPAARAVVVNGTRYTRASFENEAPTILVESPLAGAVVKSPLHATGTANTFEATFNYDLVNAAGKVVKTHFVTATAGTGTRGTFDFAAPFTVPRTGPGKLVVYELSAKDGSRIHVVEIPLTLAK